jgi:hypothetical protein
MNLKIRLCFQLSDGFYGYEYYDYDISNVVFYPKRQ